LTLPEYFDVFLENNIPKIIHGHSLEQYLSTFPISLLQNRLRLASLLISVSQPQQDAVLKLFRPKQFTILNPPIEIIPNFPSEPIRNSIRQKNQIPAKAFLWTMASVYFNENKNPIRFVEIAAHIIKLSKSPVYFQWIGGDINDNICVKAKNLVDSLNLEKYIKFTGNVSRDSYFELMNACDAFLLVSLEESFSIVAAEAVTLGKPVLSFNNKGVSEFITQENGVIVLDNSIETISQKAITLMKSIDTFSFSQMSCSINRLKISKIGLIWENLISQSFINL
jgi:glycosyltransferase involved in cell wall biosynthesis